MAKLNYKKGLKRISLVLIILIQIAGICCIGVGSYHLEGKRLPESLEPDIFMPLIFIPLAVMLFGLIALILLYAERRPNGHVITISLFFVPFIVGVLVSLTSLKFLNGKDYNDFLKIGIALIVGSVALYIVLYIVYGISLFVVKGFRESEN